MSSSSFSVVSAGRRTFWWRSVVGAGLAGGACRWRVRASSVAFSGAVVVVGFWCFGRAVRFARSLALRGGVPVAVRVRSSGGVWVWAVSVPVASPGAGAAGPPAGAVAWWALPR